MKALIIDLVIVALMSVVMMVVLATVLVGWSSLLTYVSLVVCFTALMILGVRG